MARQVKIRQVKTRGERARQDMTRHASRGFDFQMLALTDDDDVVVDDVDCIVVDDADDDVDDDDDYDVDDDDIVDDEDDDDVDDDDVEDDYATRPWQSPAPPQRPRVCLLHHVTGHKNGLPRRWSRSRIRIQ